MIYPKIEAVITSLDTAGVTQERKAILEPLITYIKEKIESKVPIALNFICTHNSRRSHLSQIWAQTLAQFYGIPNASCYSGGTEATAMFPKVAETLSKQGFVIHTIAQGSNPVYAVKYDSNAHAVVCFSKTYDDVFNPNTNFGAILTCNSANEACPIVQGAETRFPITYEDPKKFDGTPQQTEKYAERSLQIATELKYVFENIGC